jgi:tRNA nucleotidyltransferase (CCA-adding enzyme)
MTTAEAPTPVPPPAPALAVLDRLHSAGYEAYFVGGCVRDRLLGRPAGDWDVTTNARPETVVGMFEHVVPTGLAHGTVTVVAEGHPVEVTTYRVELGYTDGRRPDGVAFTAELALDLERRDFTMNAMAWDPRRDVLVDLHGGREDLAARRVRAVGLALDRFREDGLRALRAIRFATVLGLEIESSTWAAIPETLDVFRRVSAERIQVELTKILQSSRAGWGVERLAASGLLTAFLPAYPTASIDATCTALDRAGPSLALRLGLFVAPLAPLGAAAAALEGLRFSTRLTAAATALLRSEGLPAAEATTPAALRRLVAGIGRDPLEDTLCFHEAKRTPGWSDLRARIDRAAAGSGPYAVRDLALDGRAVMRVLGVAPSPAIGRVLEALLARVWEDPTANTVETLTAWLPAIYAEVIGSSRTGGDS